MALPNDQPLPFYARQGLITTPGPYAAWLDDLPTGVPALCAVLHGLLFHRSSAGLRGYELSAAQQGDAELRQVARLLAGIVERDGRPLTQARPLEQRLAIVCRDFAVMLTAFLRHRGVPARARCGFARYFGQCPDGIPDFNVDHWVCEYWKADEGRWVLVDAEIDPLEQKACQIGIDVHDVPRDEFLVAGRSWQLCRSGEADPDRFGLDLEHGLWYVQSQLVRDLAAMNKLELLCWECWGLGDADPGKEPTAEELALLDRVAALTQAGDEAFVELRALYEGDGRLRVPPVVVSYSSSPPQRVEIDGLPAHAVAG